MIMSWAGAVCCGRVRVASLAGAAEGPVTSSVVTTVAAQGANSKFF